MAKLRHFLSVTDLSEAEIMKVLKFAIKLKKTLRLRSGLGRQQKLLPGRTLVMIFEKPSLRTRLSFEIGMTQMGGHAIYLGPSDIGLNTREPASDVAKVTSRMGDIIMARTFKHETIRDLAAGSKVPVINGLSDREHPCQILADLLTILEVKKKLKGLTIAYVGDAENNVTHSLALAAEILGMNFRVGAPKGFWMDKKVVKNITRFETIDPKVTVKGADVVITDTWVSMGDEAEKAKRIKLLQSYQVTKKLMSHARPDAIFMHCLPAYRGNEVTPAVIDGPQSVVYEEAENRLHAQKALILFLLDEI